MKLAPITNDQEYDAAVNRMIELEKQPDSVINEELNALAAAVTAYDDLHTPEPPQSLRGILEVEMFKRRIKQRGMAELLEMPETRLSEMLRGKRKISMEVARALYFKLGVPAEVVLSIRG